MPSPYVVYEGVLINGPEIAFTEDRPAQDITHTPPGYETRAHLHVQFKRGHFIKVPGLTSEGLKKLLDGDPF